MVVAQEHSAIFYLGRQCHQMIRCHSLQDRHVRRWATGFPIGVCCSRTSGECRLGLPIDSILPRNGASRKPGAVQSATVGREQPTTQKSVATEALKMNGARACTVGRGTRRSPRRLGTMSPLRFSDDLGDLVETPSQSFRASVAQSRPASGRSPQSGSGLYSPQGNGHHKSLGTSVCTTHASSCPSSAGT